VTGAFYGLGAPKFPPSPLQIAEPGELCAKCMFPDMSFRHATVARLAGTPFPRRLFRCDAVLTHGCGVQTCKGGHSQAGLSTTDSRGGLANAVTDQGLSLKEYDSILEVAQNDPEVREKIGQRIRRSAK
jgi:hypothetical protein